MIKFNLFIKTLLLALVVSGIAACGGGGGGAAAPTPSPTPTPTTLTLSGTINISIDTNADSDLNDTKAPVVANDNIATAQAIFNPVNLGGYVNRPRAGDTGRSFENGDISDFYSVSLIANQNITLRISDPITSASPDLDMYLYPSTCNDSTCGSSSCSVSNASGFDVRSILATATETLTAPLTGDFFLEVCSFAGASNYSVSISQNIASAALPSLDQDFMPGEVIVKFKTNQLQAKSGVINTLASRAASIGMQPRSRGNGRVMLMALGDEVQRQDTFATLAMPWGSSAKRQIYATDPKMRLKMDTLSVIDNLRQRADVEYAEPNYIRQASLVPIVPNDPFYKNQWHYPLINLPQAWAITTGSASVIVAVADTGVVLTHPDLAGQLTTTGYDFIKSPTISVDGDGIDNNADDPGDGSGVKPSSFHGTHVAGTVAAATNNLTGVAGVSWSSKIMPIRVLGKGARGTSFDIQQGVLYAARLANSSGTLPTVRADIINLSLGGGGFLQSDQDVYTAVRNAGVIVIAAAGNENTGQLSYPASYAGVVSVSALDINKQRAPYSNFGTEIDIAAPGGDTSKDINGDSITDGVGSTAASGGAGQPVTPNFLVYQGTSMASPHMAGVVALMKAVDPTLTPAKLDTLISSGNISEDLGTAGRDDIFGHGLIDAFKAVKEAGNSAGVVTPIVTPTLVVTPGSINFGSTGSSLALNASNGGASGLAGVTVSDDQPWLTVNTTSVDGEGLGSYTATVDRSGLASGVYNAEITFASTTPVSSVVISVSMSVQTTSIESNAARHYVLLVNPVDSSTIEQTALNVSNGSYNYTFSNIAAGEYQIVAGSDLDNDGFICDAGEACGGYPTINQLTTITVNADNSSLGFTSGFPIAALNTASQANAANGPQGYQLLRNESVEDDKEFSSNEK
jgi:serine protease